MMMQVLLLLGLIICAVAAPFIKRLLTTVIVFVLFSIMAILWVLLESPDLAITEAAVGAGITTVLFIVTLYRIHELKGVDDDDKT